MGRRGWVLVVGVMLTATATGRAEWCHHKTRAPTQCGLPCYEYVWGDLKGPASIFSLNALTLDRLPSPVGIPRERVKIFQMSTTNVSIDHCSLSRVSLVLHESGEWTLTMRADQNPWMTGPGNLISTPVELHGPVSSVQPPIPNLLLQTEGLKRNQFVVKVRCYAAYPVRENIPALAPAKPILAELPTALFWVQRGIPYDFFAKQATPEIARYFDLIDRVEVEFSYR